MPAQVGLYQELLSEIQRLVPRQVRKTTVRRLALLAFGIIVSENCVLPKMAAKLSALEVSDALVSSIDRRLRRCLRDKGLDPELCYEPALKQSIDWQGLLRGCKQVVLIVDESSKEEKIHLLRVSLAYWGAALPLAWATWPHNKPLEKGSYWKFVDAVLARVARLIPAGLEVIVLADRAYDVPGFVDRVAAYGWHWLVRVKAGGTIRFLDKHGQEHLLSQLVRSHVKVPGMRWKTRGSVFKKAGWRKASVVATWAVGQEELLAVISDLPPRRKLLCCYRRRFWTEPGFRNDKKRGWHWEDSQIKAIEKHQRLLLAMAWATLAVLCLGVKEAKARCQKLARSNQARKGDGKKALKPQHPRESLFTMGLRSTYRWLEKAIGTFDWFLPDVDAPAWYIQWQRQQSYHYVLKTVRS